MNTKFHYSSVSAFNQCPYRYHLDYEQGLTTIQDDDPSNALIIGTALHKGIEADTDTALQEYFNTYPIATDKHYIEAMKLEYWIPRVKDLLPDGGLHEVNFSNDFYEGTIDFISSDGDLYDFKYSNNIDRYLESEQLHVYKYFYEEITGKTIRNLYFVFVPKTQIRQKKTENINQFKERLYETLENMEITISQVDYDPKKVLKWFTSALRITQTKDREKNETRLCDWCQYQKYCQEGENYMLLPKAERRTNEQIARRKLWIYGAPFSGKTTFVDGAPMPINLNTDGNINNVTMPVYPIKDTYEGRQKVLAWQNFKDAIDELEKGSEFKTIVVDLLEDTYESCRLYMYDKLNISHESDDSFRAWDKVRTEFLSTIRKLMNLEYENIILISHEDTTKDITKKSGDKITAIKPNISEKIANKIAGMVDIVGRATVEDDGEHKLSFKANEVVFGGGRLKGVEGTSISLDWNELCKIYNTINSVPGEEPEPRESRVEIENEADQEPIEPVEVEEKPKRTRRTRRKVTIESEEE